MGSRSLQQGGAAVQQASIELVAKAKDLAAKLLEADVDDVVLDKDAGAFHVAGTPAVAQTWADLAVAAKQEGAGLARRHRVRGRRRDLPLRRPRRRGRGRHRHGPGAPRCATWRSTTPGGCSTRCILEGQIHGGIAQGAAQALLEEFRYDEDGNPVTGNFADYAFPSAAELPSFEIIHMETPTPVNPLGAKGIGESGTIGSTPAVQSAVSDALRGLGVRHVDMPTTGERVWQAIQAAAEARPAERFQQQHAARCRWGKIRAVQPQTNGDIGGDPFADPGHGQRHRARERGRAPHAARPLHP